MLEGKMIDLHTHSTASDGIHSPSELVNLAADKKISVLAITDHDTTAGLEEAYKTAKERNIIFVPGIEISVEWPTGEFHLLGLGLKTASKELKNLTQYLIDERDSRNQKMAQKLQEQGINITYEEVKQRFKTDNLGRPHFAQVMVEKGLVKQRQLAFDRYFAKGRPCYVSRGGANLCEAVQAIKASGGAPVQAHPLSMYVSWGKMEDTMNGIIEKGVMGLEAWHPGVRVAEAERLETLAHKLNVIATAGSDFHGERIRADRHIGHTAGKKKIDDHFWTQELMPLLDDLHGGEDLSFKI